MNITDIMLAKKLAGSGGGGGGDIPIASVTLQNNLSQELFLPDFFLAFPIINSETGVIECVADDNLPVIDALDSVTFNMIASSDNHFILKIYGYDDLIEGLGDCVIEISEEVITADIFGDCTILFETDG